MITQKQDSLFLERLFEKHSIAEKDRYDIRQIYNLLSEEKRNNLVLHFEEVAKKLEDITYEVQIEQGILIGEALTEIEKAIKKAKESL